MSARMRLRRADGRVYLDRWGIEWKRLGGIFLHKMEAPDPGVDLHDHPWTFLSLILWGGYTEERIETRLAPNAAQVAETWKQVQPRGTWASTRGDTVHRNRLSLRVMRLDECHRITWLNRPTSWSLVIHGPNRRTWGFYLPAGYMPWREYEATVRAERRDMHAEISPNDRTGSRP